MEGEQRVLPGAWRPPPQPCHKEAVDHDNGRHHVWGMERSPEFEAYPFIEGGWVGYLLTGRTDRYSGSPDHVRAPPTADRAGRPAVLGSLWNRRPPAGHSEGVTASQEDACLSSIAFSMARASPRASAIAAAADTVLGVPMTGATAMRVPCASSRVRSVPAAATAANVQQIRGRGCTDSRHGSKADHHELPVAQAGTPHRGIGHLENCVEKRSVLTHFLCLSFWEFQIDETTRPTTVT